MRKKRAKILFVDEETAVRRRLEDYYEKNKHRLCPHKTCVFFRARSVGDALAKPYLPEINLIFVSDNFPGREELRDQLSFRQLPIPFLSIPLDFRQAELSLG